MTNTEEKSPSPLFIIIIIIAMIFWAAAWTSGKIVSNLMASEVIVFFRLTLSFLGMVPVVIIMGQSLKISFKNFLFLLVSATLFIFYNQFFFFGLKEGLAGAGGVLVTTLNPVITYVLMIFFYRIGLTLKTFFGLIAGLIGGAILLRFWTFDMETLLKAGNLYFILAAFTWSFLTVMSQKTQQKVHFIVYSCYLYGLGALLSLPFAIYRGAGSILNQEPYFYLNLLFISFISMAFSSTVYFFASKKLGSHRASSFILIVPVSAPIISFIFLNEIPRWYTILGGIIALTAVYLLNSKPKKASPESK